MVPRTWFGDYAWAFGSAGLLSLAASGLVMQLAHGNGLANAVPVPG